MTTFRSVNPARPDDVVGEYPAHDAADVDAAVARPPPGPARPGRRRPSPPGPTRRRRRRRHRPRQGRASPPWSAARPARCSSRRAATCRRPSTWPTSSPARAARAWGETVPSELGDKLCWTTRQPVGVVGMITPWNFPVAIPSWKIFPALLAGNGVVIKPSEHAPACCEAFVAACVEAGVPADLVQVVHGFAEPAAALAVHPGVGRSASPGRCRPGRKVAAVGHGDRAPPACRSSWAARTPWSCAPTPTSTWPSTGAVFGAFGTSGQRCTSTSRLIVHPDVAAELVDRIVKRAARAAPRRPPATRPSTSARSSPGRRPSASPAWSPPPSTRAPRSPPAARP